MNELIDRMTEAGHEWTEAREKLRRHGTYAYGLIVAAHAQGIPETRIAASDFRKLFDPQMVIMTAYHDVGLPDRIPGKGLIRKPPGHFVFRLMTVKDPDPGALEVDAQMQLVPARKEPSHFPAGGRHNVGNLGRTFDRPRIVIPGCHLITDP
jgi:hypothetical protein